MKSFPPEIRFSLPWRDYQARVLDELQKHLDDNHLHIIAAPGSGKTILGLEVVRRLNRPALILAPTIAIRDQWVDRFIGLFCPPQTQAAAWISRDLRAPKLLTVSTYQGLHSAYTGAAETEDDSDEEENARTQSAPKTRSSRRKLIDAILKAGVSTLVVDEAHHLRSEWWKCLIDLKKQLPECVVVALTATPPLDVAPVEWQRYSELCGAVDAEITVPELVLQDNLCPHQDYVYLSTPLESEKAQLADFRREVAAFLKQLYANDAFTHMLRRHPCVDHPSEHIEHVLADAAFFSSIGIYLHHVTGRAPRRLMRIIGGHRHLPRLNLEWMETLLTGCLYAHRDDFESNDALCDELSRNLHRAGAVERRQVLLRNTPAVARLLVTSLSKLRSIAEIARLENQALGPDLRMVILTDFIRRADLPRDPDDLKPLTRIGVVPIFETLRRDLADGAKLGILSGSIVVIPRASVPHLQSIASDMGIAAANLRCTPMRHDDTYCTVDASGQDRQQIVRLITRLFNAGGLTILVGTKSLLGEGWDAPSINALILASFVGSYMLSNQMRGRAIRTQHGNPDKTANIWHLVCTETRRAEPGEDLDMLTRRFRSFVGVSFDTPAIENGIGRLGIGRPPFTEKHIEQLDARMIARALDRDDLRRRWREALGAGEDMMLAEEVAAEPAALPRRFVFFNTIAALLWQGLMWGLVVFSRVVPSQRQMDDMERKVALLVLAVAAVIGSLAALPNCLRALWLFVRHGPIRSSMKQVAKAVLRSCIEAELIATPRKKLGIRTEKLEGGAVACRLNGADLHEKSLFLEAMQELLGPVENPRYILIRKSPLGRFIRKDYHAVPTVLGRNRETAAHFAQMWQKYVGPAQLIYTRTPDGRQILLKARAAAMSTSFQPRAARLKSWK